MAGFHIPAIFCAQMMKVAHALQELDFGREMEIKSVTLETLTNETMVGLLGITVLHEDRTPR